MAGANGSGKSTLGRILSGADRPTAGVVRRPGSCLLIPERVPDLAGCSADVLAAALGRRVAAGERRRRLAAALDALGSSHGPRTRLRQLSKGNVQKAYLAVAYAVRPAALIADEPFSGLDAAAGRAAELLLRDIAAAGSVVVAMTHGLVGGADRSYELVGGALTERAAVPVGRLVEIELGPAARLAGLAPPTAWPSEVVIDRAAGVVAAPPEQVAAILRWALDGGLDVIRIDPGGRTS